MKKTAGHTALCSISATRLLLWLGVIACFVLGSISCNSDKEGYLPPAARKKPVTVRAVATTGTGDTRTISDPVAHGSTTVLDRGLLIFTTSAGIIEHVMEVQPGVSVGNIIGIDDLTSAQGVTINNITEDSELVYFFGNHLVSAPAMATDIEDFKKTQMTFLPLMDSSGGVSTMQLYGFAPIEDAGRVGRAQVDVIPIASRLEIVKFARDAVNIDHFEVNAIFLNNFYLRGDITGVVRDEDIAFYNSEDDFVMNSGSAPGYNAMYNGYSYDYNALFPIGTHSGTDYIPSTAGAVWAYNMFSGEVPHLVIKFADVTATAEFTAANGGVDPFSKRQYWYITISSLTSGFLTLSSFEQGKVYVINEIEVSPGTLHPIPEPGHGEEYDVQLKIIPWIPVDVSTTLPNLPW